MDDLALARDVGERIRAKRRSREMTLRELSERSGVTLSRLGRIELGERELSIGALVRVAAALETRASELLGEPAVSDPVAAFASGLPAEPEEMRRRLVEALRVLAGG